MIEISYHIQFWNDYCVFLVSSPARNFKTDQTTLWVSILHEDIISQEAGDSELHKSRERSTHKVITRICAHRSDGLFAHGARDAAWSRGSGGLLRQLLLQLCEHLCSIDEAYSCVCEAMIWTSSQLSTRHFRVLGKLNGFYPQHMQISFWCYSLLPWLCGENHNINI